MELTTLPDSWYGLLGVIVTTGGTIVMGLITYAKKRDADQKDKEAQPVIEEAEKQTNTQMVVNHLVEQMAQVQTELFELRPIRDVKYPFALDHIRHLRREHPQTKVTVPHQILPDL